MNDSIIVRPVKLEDLPKLIELLDTLSDSLTTMPRDENVLERRIHKSIQSFYPGVGEAGPEQYLFVMEDVDSGRLLGTSAIIARVGGYEPFYTYRIEQERIEHQPLNIRKDIDVLHLEANHNGPSEIGSLFMHPSYRRGGLGRLLSLSRFMFAQAFPVRFRSTVIAELRGYIDEEGKSPFWETVGRHFFDQEFDQADFLSGIGNKEFIKDLMPTHPIYLPLLPKSTADIIGKVHRDTEAAKAILKSEGFGETRDVDIFDAGPMLEAKFSHLRCVKEFQSGICSVSDSVGADEAFIISNTRLEFESCLGNVLVGADGRCGISKKTAELLNLGDGDSVQFTPIRAENK